MSQVGTQESLFDVDSPNPWKVWLAVFVLALLVHLFIFFIRIPWSPSSILSPPRVAVQQVDPKKLDAIRKQWKDKGFLLNKDRTQPKSEEASPDARYWSDRNTRVEKEQRARKSTVIPKSGSSSEKVQSPSTQQKRTSNSPQIKNLGSLGVPLKLDGKANQEPAKVSARKSQQAGIVPHTPQGEGETGDQAILDHNLPEGSENLLNTQESVYYSFYARLYETIGPLWQRLIQRSAPRLNLAPGDYSTEVDVVLDGQGNLIAVNQIHSSGIREFDEAVETSWRQIQRFPNPPKGLLDGSGEVHTGWTFNVLVTQSMRFQYRPPERNY